MINRLFNLILRFKNADGETSTKIKRHKQCTKISTKLVPS